jgi:hypothetical protein
MASKERLLDDEEWDKLPYGPAPHCGRCGSDELKSYPILLKTGTSSSRTVGAGLPLAVGGAVTQTTSEIADEVDPPKKPSSTLALVVCLSVCTMLLWGTSLSLLPILLIGLGVFSAYVFFIKDTELEDYEYGRAMYVWKNSWCCMKCGKVSVSLHQQALDAMEKKKRLRGE